MKKHTKINSVLEKKLEELEYLRGSITSNDDDLNVYREIELRLIFAKTLLAAEISSRQTDMEGEEVSEERLKLACMATRLDELEDALKTNQYFGHDEGSLDTNDCVVDGETGSVSSCVKSCQDEFGEEEVEKEEVEGDEDAEQWPLFQDASSEDNKEATFPAAAEGEEDAEQWPLFQDASSEDNNEPTFPAAAVKEEVVVREVEEKRRFGFWGLVRFGLVGVIITFLLGYIGDITEDDFFLTPT